MNPAHEDRGRKSNSEKFGAALRRVVEGLCVAVQYSATLKREVGKIGELGDRFCHEFSSMTQGIREEKSEHFRIVRPRLFESLEARLEEGRIVEGQFLKATQHQIAAEAMNETALAFTHDFRRAVQVRPSENKFCGAPLHYRRAAEAYERFNTELREFQYEVDCAAYRKIEGLGSLPAPMLGDIETDFPHLDLRLLILGLKRGMVQPRNAFSVLTMSESYEQMLSDLSDQIMRECLTGVSLELET